MKDKRILFNEEAELSISDLEDINGGQNTDPFADLQVRCQKCFHINYYSSKKRYSTITCTRCGHNIRV